MTGHEQMLDRARRSNPVPHLETVHESDLADLDSLLNQRRSLMTDLTRMPIGTDEKPPSKRGKLRPALVFVSTLALVLLAVGLVALLTTGGGNEFVDEPVPTTEASPMTTAAESPIEPPPASTPAPELAPSDVTLFDGTWRRFSNGGQFSAYDLASTNFGLVVAAHDRGLWKSSDGETWEQVDLEYGEFGGVLRVVPYGSGANAFGMVAESSTAPGVFMTWRSDDGEVWTPVELNPAEAGYWVETYLAVDDELIVFAWGNDEYPSGMHVLWSEDGVSFTHSSPEEAGLVGVSLLSAIPADDGFLGLAMGQPEISPFDFLLYRSDDGRSWEALPQTVFPVGANPGGIVQHGENLFAFHAWEGPITPDGGPQMAIWRAQSDGSWESLKVPTPGGNSGIGSMIVTDYGLLAVGGYEDFELDEVGGVVLTTADGVVFEPIPDPAGVFRGGTFSTEAVQFGDRIVIMDGSDILIWTPGK